MFILFTQPVINGEGGKQAARILKVDGAKPAPPGSMSRKKPAASFLKVLLLLGRRGYEFYCQCQALDKKKAPAAARQQGQLV